MATNQAPPTVSFNELPLDIQKLVRKAQIKAKISTQHHERIFGNVPPVEGIHAYGRMQVAIRGRIVTSNNPELDWEVPSDFLVSYLIDTLGTLWLENELSKNNIEMHEVARWYSKGISNLDGKGSRWGKANGKALAILHLAYDLFVLESLDHLPDFILERLRNNENFNGARYELFVFSTMIRAGFVLEYSDEKSGLNGRVAECIATHTESKERVYVEAKTRNIKHVLGSKQGNSKKIRLYDKIKDAMGKKFDAPYFIFIDVNQPNIVINKENREFNKINTEYKKLEDLHKGNLPNLVCFTNIPFHYGADNIIPKNNVIGFMTPKSPRFKLNRKMLKKLILSIKKYDYIPAKFKESDVYAESILDDLNQ
jgi:hypothetical protein